MMSDMEWKIEDGALVVWEDFGEATWRRAFADEAATIIQSVIASTKEQCAIAVDATVKDHDEDTPGGWCAANAARYAAAAIRSLKITGEGNG